MVPCWSGKTTQVNLVLFATRASAMFVSHTVFEKIKYAWTDTESSSVHYFHDHAGIYFWIIEYNERRKQKLKLSAVHVYSKQ